MPIYEFYCDTCHTIFNFFSRKVNTEKIPGCPRCGKEKLDRKVSLFAVSSGGAKGDEESGEDLPFDESTMEKAVEALAGEAENINEDDPRQAAGLMRKLSDMTGIEYGEKMREALGRMEAGEDPEEVEAEMGDALESEDPFVLPGKKGKGGGRRRLPARDETLYEL